MNDDMLTENRPTASWKLLLPLMVVAALAGGAMYAQSTGSPPALHRALRRGRGAEG